MGIGCGEGGGDGDLPIDRFTDLPIGFRILDF